MLNGTVVEDGGMAGAVLSQGSHVDSGLHRARRPGEDAAEHFVRADTIKRVVDGYAERAVLFRRELCRAELRRLA
ncbi:hypothetical protein P3102_28155 [Amycolatopsis sp. QT-25]|uniref:hypothetical protein n=1 Tax=Amycolatopsis sp. QT-25 TaxID=3034022 RepID=UPI0023EAFF41|nr:hypothetical protein [Amycolatopsis sp. QT-25]WET77920.1 hypothetical protein P3102_28155 [Amycolatopsis sp. QT-25]